MDFSWKIVIDAGAISLAILIATLLRVKIRFFQKYLIPNALTAGFLLLPCYNYLFPALGYSTNRLGVLVYHLLNISFIAMTLRSAPPKVKGHTGGGVAGMATGILFGYAFQALLGLGLTLFFLPKIFPSFGLFLPLGFASGPGQSFAIGKGWETMGFEGASTVGLTMAAIGYLWGCFGGIFLIHRGLKRGWLGGEGIAALKDKAILTGIVPLDAPKPVGARLTTDNEAVDSFSFHASVVVFVYLLSYLLLSGITYLLSFAGKMGNELATNLWGLNFIFSAVIAIAARKLLDRWKLGGHLDDDTLSRISGFAVDYMLAGSVAAISLVFIGKYWFPILLMSTVCGILTMITVPWMCSRMFKDYRFERMLMIYGVSTGTLSTGLALLRVTDPEFKTSVAPDYMLSAGLTFVLAIPFILSINFPAWAYTRGDMIWYWAMGGVALAYLVFILIAYRTAAGKKAFAKPGKLWYQD
ncbi:MAG: sodium:glutamate symporter [Spirochaetaceae bacterium]|nr:sodium:glutamate symporter [Spirochaetaceae bacterium]